MRPGVGPPGPPAGDWTWRVEMAMVLAAAAPRAPLRQPAESVRREVPGVGRRVPVRLGRAPKRPANRAVRKSWA